MNVFDQHLDEVRQALASGDLRIKAGTCLFDPERTWPRGRPGDIILSTDTAIELGHPQTESLAFLMWTDSSDMVVDGRITVVGPDLDGLAPGKAPFGKIVLAGVHGFTGDNAYDRFQELDMIRFRLCLEGYMLRAVPQQNREWGRVSRQARMNGLSLRMIGNELIREYRKLDYVDAAEVIFITSSPQDIRLFRPTGEKAARIIGAMNRIFDDLEQDCDACGFRDVCDEVEGLRDMHRKARGKR
ncbi:MAG TPA: hypothetical protein PK350_08765 [Deltaproteobacteria bacterium]|nr:hypothetical protein [Deltaproteobacteria bacterium]HPR55886.1 hypothetical protein [Deltaproteobacteria bacterium]